MVAASAVSMRRMRRRRLRGSLFVAAGAAPWAVRMVPTTSKHGMDEKHRRHQIATNQLHESYLVRLIIGCIGICVKQPCGKNGRFSASGTVDQLEAPMHSLGLRADSPRRIA
jgi:hypothetical protein